MEQADKTAAAPRAAARGNGAAPTYAEADTAGRHEDDEDQERREVRAAGDVADSTGVDARHPADADNARRESVWATLKELRPGCEIEAMVAAQLLMTHAMAVACFQSATELDRGERLRPTYMREATRLLALYGRHVDCLDRARRQRLNMPTDQQVLGEMKQLLSLCKYTMQIA